MQVEVAVLVRAIKAHHIIVWFLLVFSPNNHISYQTPSTGLRHHVEESARKRCSECDQLFLF